MFFSDPSLHGIVGQLFDVALPLTHRVGGAAATDAEVPSDDNGAEWKRA